MPNKKISEFPVTTSLAGSDNFLFNHLGSTSTVAFSSLSAVITNDSIKLPSGSTGGQVLTYNGSTTTWVASAVPKELPQTATEGEVLTYNSSTSTWVASSLSANGFNVSLSSIGYQKLPSGLIMQWGKDSTSVTSDGGERTITFPTPFTTACFQVLVSPENNDGSTSRDFIPQVKTISTTNVIVYNNSLGGITGTLNVPVIWFAIGY